VPQKSWVIFATRILGSLNLLFHNSPLKWQMLWHKFCRPYALPVTSSHQCQTTARYSKYWLWLLKITHWPSSLLHQLTPVEGMPHTVLALWCQCLLRNLICRTNFLIRTFDHCSLHAKTELFRAFCWYIPATVELWASFSVCLHIAFGQSS